MQSSRAAMRRMQIVGELFSFFASNKRWWMIPVVLSLFVLGLLIVLAQGSAIAPFIYSLF